MVSSIAQGLEISNNQRVSPAFGKKNNETGLQECNGRDHCEFSFKGNNKSNKISQEQKNEIIHNAKVTSAGWSAFAGPLASIYFALMKDDEIAKKYNLNAENDKEFIKEVREKQLLATIPGAVGWLGFIAPGIILGGLSWAYFKFKEDPQDQDFLRPEKLNQQND